MNNLPAGQDGLPIDPWDDKGVCLPNHPGPQKMFHDQDGLRVGNAFAAAIAS